jgi:hypothetical protein
MELIFVLICLNELEQCLNNTSRIVSFKVVSIHQARPYENEQDFI